MIKYSIIICSYNRFELLNETINSVLSVIEERNDCEILIIDNKSTDLTATLEEKFSSNKTVKYFLETIQGLSQARNRGMKEATGEILVYLDDDIELVPNYFAICDEIFSDLSISISGGKVLPFKTDIPSWLPKNFYFLVSIYDLGDSSKFVKHLMGGNFAIRRKDALQIGLYNTSLGRNGKILGGNEEVDYQNRASAMGYKMHYHPKQNILHKINEKLNEDYILTYSKELGKSGRIMDKSISKFLVIKKTIMSCCAIIAHVLLGKLITNERRKFYLKGINQYSRGYLNKP
ncbi:glycosyltransferase family 2 protein [Flavobacterium sp. 3-210]